MEKYNFDLNIKNILKEWDVSDAIRELISNAIDEYKISNSEDIKIYKKNNEWIIQDFGRGIKKEDFIQNESKEKQKFDQTIGMFGIGLKDAIAVLYRKKINMKIETSNFIATPILTKKIGFNDKTIHMEISDKHTNILGTKISIVINDGVMEKAKSNFLKFSKYKEIIKNDYGEIIESDLKTGIYFNGLMISENNDLTFSYNLIKKDARLNKGLNRERKNVGKNAYSNLLKKVFQNIDNIEIAEKIAKEILNNKPKSEEFKLKEIREFVYLNIKNVVFINEKSYKSIGNYDKELLSQNGEIIIVRDSDENWLKNNEKLNKVWWATILFEHYEDLRNNVEETPYNPEEKKEKLFIIYKIYDQLKHANKFKLNFTKDNIKISKKLINNKNKETLGIWMQNKKELWISENILNNEQKMISTFFHEVAHSINNDEDVTKEFEDKLALLTYICSKYIWI